MVFRLNVVAFLAVALIYSTNVNADEKETECSPFPFVSLENGYIQRIGYQKYQFSCNRGYLLVTRSIVRCFQGNWTSLKEPNCIKSQYSCDDPPEVANAVILGEDRAIGSLIQYNCKPGFQLVGKREMSCTNTRHWDGRTPICMDENEPLEKVAERLNKSFISKLSIRNRYRNLKLSEPLKFVFLYVLDECTSIASNLTLGKGGRYLDPGSLRHGLDLVLLIDRSSSVDPVDLETTKKFVNFLLKRFEVKNEPNKEGGTQAALLTFGTEVQIVFNMNNYDIKGPLEASQAISTIEPNGGGTNIAEALTTVIVQVSRHFRKKSKKALFLMTDGEPTIINPFVTAGDIAQNLRNGYNFEIFTVGIGKYINRNFLADVASKPPLSHMFILSEYPDLNKLMKIIEDDRPPPPPMSKTRCGYDHPLEITSPWLAILYISGGGALRNIKVCGGVLICSQWVLTAASCLMEGAKRIPKEEVFVMLGERDLLRDEKNETNFYVLDMYLHRMFDPSDPLNNNLALVKLNIPTDGYRPVCLPRTDILIPMHKDLNANTSIAGWGLNADTPTHPSGASVQWKVKLSSVSLAQEDECPEMKHMPLFCAGRSQETCLGLMGSPVVAVDPETRLNHVLGVVAGRSHCLKGRNQYVELTSYLRWIHLTTKHCQQNHMDLKT